MEPIKKTKYYVVWTGHVPGIYDNWEDCKQQVDNFKGAKYKSFESLQEASAAFKNGYKAYQNELRANKTIIYPSIAVDASCMGNPGIMEYQGVDTATKKLIFKQGPFEMGTNNIGEFLAIVHALALFKQQNQPQIPIYTDSVTAMSWVKNKKIKTNLEQNEKNKILFELVARAEQWLRSNTYENPIIKWETDLWGEIPADFNRKNK